MLRHCARWPSGHYCRSVRSAVAHRAFDSCAHMRALGSIGPECCLLHHIRLRHCPTSRLLACSARPNQCRHSPERSRAPPARPSLLPLTQRSCTRVGRLPHCAFTTMSAAMLSVEPNFPISLSPCRGASVACWNAKLVHTSEGCDGVLCHAKPTTVAISHYWEPQLEFPRRRVHLAEHHRSQNWPRCSPSLSNSPCA